MPLCDGTNALQTAAEGTNTFGRESSIYPVLDTYEEGAVIEMKVVISTFHWVSRLDRTVLSESTKLLL